MELNKNAIHFKWFQKAKPIYKEFDGWNDVFEVNFLKYMTFIEKELDTEISYVSYGPKTEEIMEKEILSWI